MPLFDEGWLDMLEEDESDHPQVQCGICGVQHSAPECKWNDAEEDSGVKF